MKSLLLSAAICVLPSLAFAQDFGLSGPPQIESETLGAAKDFDAGVLQEGALPTNLWHNERTRAARMGAPARNLSCLTRRNERS